MYLSCIPWIALLAALFNIYSSLFIKKKNILNVPNFSHFSTNRVDVYY